MREQGSHEVKVSTPLTPNPCGRHNHVAAVLLSEYGVCVLHSNTFIASPITTVGLREPEKRQKGGDVKNGDVLSEM